jgi:hypothetical protein
LQLSLFPHTSSQKTSLGKESVKQLRTSITKLTGRRGCEVPRLLFPKDCTELGPSSLALTSRRMPRQWAAQYICQTRK